MFGEILQLRQLREYNKIVSTVHLGLQTRFHTVLIVLGTIAYTFGERMKLFLSPQSTLL